MSAGDRSCATRIVGPEKRGSAAPNVAGMAIEFCSSIRLRVESGEVSRERRLLGREAEGAQEALADEHDVVAALAQVRVVERGEAARDRLARGRHRPLGAAALLGDLALHGVGERLVAEHQQ